MKKTIAILLCVICIGAHSAKQDLSNERSKMKETSKIEDEYSSGTLGKSQFIKKLTVCSNNGNILCTLRLTDIYLTEKNDSKALPLLQKQAVYNSQSNDDISSMIRTNANYALGESYMFGTGVLQDFDKALKYFEVGAINGDKDSIIRISQLYFNKASITPRGSEFTESFMKGYAYLKIAQSLSGEIKIYGNDGKFVNPIKAITQMQELDYFKPYIKEADALTKKLCLTIQGCRQ